MQLTVGSLILGMELKKLRDNAGLSAKTVGAEWLRCSTSRIYAIEGGYRGISRVELDGLVKDAYGQPNLLPKMQELHRRIERGEDKPVPDPPAKYPDSMLVHDLEPWSTGAFGAILDQIPKLVQTPSYMQAQHRMAGYNTAEIESLVQASITRQERFFSLETPPLTRIIITEGAIDRARYVPGQVDLLAERMEHPALEIRVIPNSAGPHFSFASFTLMEFGQLPSILYTDVVNGGSLSHDDGDVAIAWNRWYALSRVASTVGETLEIIGA
jgi:hypothetical protein